MKRMRTLGLLVCALASVASRGVAQDAGADEPRALLQRAFERTLRAPGVRSLELRIHRRGELVARRSFDVAYRRDSRQSQSLLRFTAPSWLRGHALLVVETSNGVSDTWLYQTEERRPRRVATTQKADAFYGSDLSFEELEHLRFERWILRPLPAEAGLVVIEAIPRGVSQYGRLVAWVDPARAALARIDFFRGAEQEAAKRLRVELEAVAEEAGYLRVERFRIEQLGRDDWTEVVTQRMVIDPAIPSEVFSTAFLEREGDDLYALVARRAALEAAP